MSLKFSVDVLADRGENMQLICPTQEICQNSVET